MGRLTGRIWKGGLVKRSVRLVMSVISGIAAVTIAMAYASSVRQQAEAAQREALARYGGELVTVCVASRDIEPGDALDEGNVAVEEWVASLLPPDACTSLSDVAGKIATSRIPQRAVLTPVYLEANAGALEIPVGKVAVCVACDAQHAVGGSLDRGDTVEVYVSDASVADRLLSARVLDTSVISQGGGELSWVTLAVDPGRVQEVISAMSTGPVTLVAPGGGLARPAGTDAVDDDSSDETAGAPYGGASGGSDGNEGGDPDREPLTGIEREGKGDGDGVAFSEYAYPEETGRSGDA